MLVIKSKPLEAHPKHFWLAQAMWASFCPTQLTTLPHTRTDKKITMRKKKKSIQVRLKSKLQSWILAFDNFPCCLMYLLWIGIICSSSLISPRLPHCIILFIIHTLLTLKKKNTKTLNAIRINNISHMRNLPIFSKLYSPKELDSGKWVSK